MKNCIVLIALLSFALTAKAQDLIKKTDATLIKAKVISFQNNYLVIMQEDGTQMTLPRKVIAEIKFDYMDDRSGMSQNPASNETTVHNEVIVPETTLPSSYASTPIRKTKSPDARIYEAPAQVQAPEPTVITKSVTTSESPAQITGFKNRVLLSAPKFLDQAPAVGRVAVTVCLNADGSVVSAKFKPRGSSTLDTNLISRAVQNAKEFKFSKGENGECGVLMYSFNL